MTSQTENTIFTNNNVQHITGIRVLNEQKYTSSNFTILAATIYAEICAA